MITEAEMQIVQMLGDVWNEYLKLPVEHPTEQSEFCTAIHACQDKILARTGRRETFELLGIDEQRYRNDKEYRKTLLKENHND